MTMPLLLKRLLALFNVNSLISPRRCPQPEDIQYWSSHMKKDIGMDHADPPQRPLFLGDKSW
ncbi:hypothetical protein SAMN05444358_11718 [Ruegeria halocynthiae]|uniref:Uncharacterized protein n=1 Tax=Ruegeria halocynthiae TaxID=985054 RepID=A0A1H3FR24_9RHOB|nr:hypothetical protein SAMN05444358_11718 [Ruegeria halocynthiae]